MAYQVRNLDHFLNSRLTRFRLSGVDCIAVSHVPVAIKRHRMIVKSIQPTGSDVNIDRLYDIRSMFHIHLVYYAGFTAYDRIEDRSSRCNKVDASIVNDS